MVVESPACVAGAFSTRRQKLGMKKYAAIVDQLRNSVAPDRQIVVFQHTGRNNALVALFADGQDQSGQTDCSNCKKNIAEQSAEGGKRRAEGQRKNQAAEQQHQRNGTGKIKAAGATVLNGRNLI